MLTGQLAVSRNISCYYASQEVVATNQSVALDITLQEQAIMASEVVVSASRMEEAGALA